MLAVAQRACSEGTKAVFISLEGEIAAEAIESSGIASADPNNLFARMGLNLGPSRVVPKIRWTADNRPDVAKRSAHYLLLDMSPRRPAPNRRALFGLGLARLARALLEGSTYAVRAIVDQRRAVGLALDEMRVAGSRARSPSWNQIKAGGGGQPVAAPNNTEITPLETALPALVGSSAYASLREAGDHNARAAEPEPNLRPACERPYQFHGDAGFGLAPAFDRAVRGAGTM